MDIGSFVLLNATNPVLGTSACLRSSNTIATTVQSQGIYIYDVVTQQCLASCFVPSQSHQVTCAALLHDAAETIFFVADSTNMCCWKLSEKKKDFPSLHKTRLPKRDPIHSLITTPALEKKFFIVYTDGTLSSFDTENSEIQELRKASEDSTVQWVQLFEKNSEVILLLLVEQKGSYFLKIHSVGTNEVVYKNEVELEIPTEGARILSVAFNLDPIYFSVIWSTQELAIYRATQLDDLLDPDSLGLALHVSRDLDYFDVSKGLQMTFLRNMLYLLGRRKGSPVTPTKPTPNKKTENNNKRAKIDTPAGPTGQLEIIAWDPVFGTAIDSTLITANVEANDEFLSLTTNSDQKRLHLTTKGAVIICPVPTIVTSSLSSSLGAHAKTQKFLRSEASVTISPTVPLSFQDRLASAQAAACTVQTFDSESWNDIIKTSHQRGTYTNMIENALSSKTETPKLDQFMDLWTDYVQQVATEPNIKLTPEHGMFFTSKFPVSFKMFQRSFVDKVISRCLSEDLTQNLWREVLGCFIVSRSVSFQETPALLDTILASQQLDLLYLSLIEGDFSAVQLTSILSWAVSKLRLLLSLPHLVKPAPQLSFHRLPNDHHQKYLKSIPSLAKQQKEYLKSPINHIFGFLLSYPVNKFLLVPALKKLSSKEVQAIAQYLVQWLKFYLTTPRTSTTSAAANTFRPPSLLTAVIWSQLILDAHFSQFILSPPLLTILTELENVVKGHLLLCDGALMLSAIHKSKQTEPDFAVADFFHATLKM